MPKTTGSKLFAEMMVGYGVSHIFFVPAIMMKAMADMEDMPIRVEKPGEIRGALDHAFGLDRPVVIDVVSDVNVLAKRVRH